MIVACYHPLPLFACICTLTLLLYFLALQSLHPSHFSETVLHFIAYQWSLSMCYTARNMFSWIIHKGLGSSSTVAFILTNVHILVSIPFSLIRDPWPTESYHALHYHNSACVKNRIHMSTHPYNTTIEPYRSIPWPQSAGQMLWSSYTLI